MVQNGAVESPVPVSVQAADAPSTQNVVPAAVAGEGGRTVTSAATRIIATKPKVRRRGTVLAGPGRQQWSVQDGQRTHPRDGGDQPVAGEHLQRGVHAVVIEVGRPGRS